MKGWGTPVEVALYASRPVKTVRHWADTGAVPAACRLNDHALVVHAESTRRHAESRPSRRRRLRGAA